MLSAYGFVRFYLHFSPGFCTVSCKVKGAAFVYFSYQRAGEPPGDSREGGARSPHHSGLWRLLPGRAFYLVRGQIPALNISSVILGLQRFPVIWLSVQLGSCFPESRGHGSLPAVHTRPPPQVRGACRETLGCSVLPRVGSGWSDSETKGPVFWASPTSHIQN